MEEWLRPKKREVKKKTQEQLDEAAEDAIMANPTPMNLQQRRDIKARRAAVLDAGNQEDDTSATEVKPLKATGKTKKPPKKTVVTPSPSEDDVETMEDDEDEGGLPDLTDGDDDDHLTPPPSSDVRTGRPAARQSARKAAKARKSYAESEGETSS
jgi:UV DNA damage endonuclease